MALSLSSKANPFPYAVIGIASYTGKAETVYNEDASVPELDLAGTKATDEISIVQTLARAGGLAEDSEKASSFIELAQSIPKLTALPDITSVLDRLDDHLAFRTFLVGHTITAADWMVWGAIKGSSKVLGIMRNNKHPHLSRLYNYLDYLESTQAALAALAATKANKLRSNKTAASFALGLEGAKEGEVVTRFPPEPSGYLHIGHAKAAMLNQYFAKMYKGKLIIRFDDTNPSKERSEFEETILEDLHLLDIHGDRVTHTSDYFDQIYDLAIKVIKDGKAYADNTPKAEMQHQRWHGLPSAHRDDSVEDNLKHFEEMKSGSEEGLKWCLRAKISFENPNKALRDPVIYRCNIEPHHRTGTAWKIYPTYDFACPVVDSLEGVTHALRTNEYRDRNPQYHWMEKAAGLRKVAIWDFSRLNFIYTLLSKRKLHWFVDTGIVRGWDDPRFPTVRGIRRRGLTVEALSQFMLMQGPSQSVVSLEWDSIWAMNKKVIDPVAPRHWAILDEAKVPVTIKGGPTAPEIKTLPKHKKNDAVGTKKTVYTSTILIEQEDAQSFEDQEEITLMDWGNAILRSNTKDSSGVVTSMEMDLNLEGDFRKTKKKVTWLAQPTQEHPLVSVRLLDHDYLITKKKLEEDDKPVDFLSNVSEYVEDALADANVSDLKTGEIMQFERKGYYIYDGQEKGKKQFIRIPDGRAASLASKAGLGKDVQVDPAVQKAREAAKSESKAVNAPASNMYEVERIYGDDIKFDSGTSMYKVDNIYAS